MAYLGGESADDQRAYNKYLAKQRQSRAAKRRLNKHSSPAKSYPRSVGRATGDVNYTPPAPQQQSSGGGGGNWWSNSRNIMLEQMRQARLAAAERAAAERRERERLLAVQAEWGRLRKDPLTALTGVDRGPLISGPAAMIVDGIAKPGAKPKDGGLDDNPIYQAYKSNLEAKPVKDDGSASIADVLGVVTGKRQPGQGAKPEQPEAITQYLDMLEDWQNRDSSPSDDRPVGAGADGSMFPELAGDLGLSPSGSMAFPSLTSAAPGFMLIKDEDTGDWVVKSAMEVFQSYGAQFASPALAGPLAADLDAAGFYTDAQKKALDKRFFVREGKNGEQSLEILAGEADADALEKALKWAANEQARLARSGKFKSVQELLDERVERALGLFDADGDGEADIGKVEAGAAGGVRSASGAPMLRVQPGQSYAGYKLDDEQVKNLNTIYQVGVSMGANQRDIGIAIITSIVESNIRNVDHGDRDSLGVFQQRPSQGWGSATQVRDVGYAAKQFFSRLLKIEDRDKMSMGQAAQKVQRSAYPDRYDKHVKVASAMLGDPAAAKSAPLKMLGAVAPNAEQAAREISGKFGIGNIDGKATSGHIPGSDHYSGKAIDVMLEGKKSGKQVINYVLENADRLGVKDIIHNKTYYKQDASGKWVTEPYTGENPHTGHVHVGFNAGGGFSWSGGAVASGGSGGSPYDSGNFYYEGDGAPGGSSRGSGGGSAWSGPGGVPYSDANQVTRIANDMARDRLGRELDESELAELTSMFHSAEADAYGNSVAGVGVSAPDLQGMVLQFIDSKLGEEFQMQQEGELAMAAFRLLAGGLN